VGGGVQTESTRHRGHVLSYRACPGWLWGWTIIRWNEDWQGKPKYSEKTCPSSTLSNTNLTWPDPGSNPGRRDGKPASNLLSYGAACPSLSYLNCACNILMLYVVSLVCHATNFVYAVFLAQLRNSLFRRCSILSSYVSFVLKVAFRDLILFCNNLITAYSKCHVTSNKDKSNLECAEVKFQTKGWVRGCDKWKAASWNWKNEC
jgi:hypothetical protein